jgi:hypothetical protein
VTSWRCERCGKSGRIILPGHTDAWSGILAVYDAHRAVSPLCPERYYVRVWMEGEMRAPTTAAST